MRVVANESDHEKIVAVAKETPEAVISDGARVVAEWLPVAAKSRAHEQLMEFDDFITRQNETGIEVLVVHSQRDLTKRHIRQSEFSTNRGPDGRFFVTVTTTDEGSYNLALLTSTNAPDKTNNLYRHVAMVIHGEIYYLPRIEGQGSHHFIIQTTSLEQGQRVADILSRTVQRPRN